MLNPMKINIKLFYLLVLIVISGCGDDDEGPGGSDIANLNELQGFWTTDVWVTGPGGATGLLTMEFEASTARGEISALDANEWGFTCSEQTFRNIMPQDANSFTSESLIRFIGGTSEWVPTTIRLVTDDQVSISFDCDDCGNEVLILDRITSGAASLIISGDITQPTTLTNVICDANTPDYIVTDLIDVDDVLTIEPGVVIAFEANAGLVISRFGGGTIVAVGTSSNPITFTGTTKTKGFWVGLDVESNDVRNELDYVIVEYAGSDEIADDIKGGIKGGVSIEGESGGLFGSLKVTNSIFRENDGYGLIAEWIGVLRSFSNNTFENNTNAAVLVEAQNVAVLDAASSYTGGNGYEGVEIFGTRGGDALLDNSTWTAFDDGSSYYVSKTIEVRARLIILPGATFEFEANQEIVFRQDQFGPNDGVIVAEGTSDNPITFTGFDKSPGYWKGIVIQSSSTLNQMEYCVVEYGGSDPIAGSTAGNIGLDKNGAFDAPNLNLFNSTIRNSAGCGVVVESDQSMFVESDNTFSGNTTGSICNL